MIGAIGVIAAQDKPDALALERELEAWLRERGVVVRQEEELTEASADILVVLGGDGLLMRAARRNPNLPILGINFGRVGFLATVEQAQWRQALEQVLAGGYNIQNEPTLTAEVRRNGCRVYRGWAVNDVVLRAGRRTIDVELYVDDKFVNVYPGDGFIVATPQGSTAYCLAAGGPIVTAGVRGLVGVPIACHSPIKTALVVPETARIDLVVVSRDVACYLSLDGHDDVDLAGDEEVLVRRGSRRFRLVTFPETNFYAAFRSKFNYATRPGSRPSREGGIGGEGMGPHPLVPNPQSEEGR